MPEGQYALYVRYKPTMIIGVIDGRSHSDGVWAALSWSSGAIIRNKPRDRMNQPVSVNKVGHPRTQRLCERTSASPATNRTVPLK
ncbi:hypothetical protein [Leptospira perolatii]|uniref:hypothetical protein n=1 Tax=Leptospira perolatii TaxID=2023191 RepID=UPI000F62E97C|nr:hypothetical protein [Leptospira perolatii]